MRLGCLLDRSSSSSAILGYIPTIRLLGRSILNSNLVRLPSLLAGPLNTRLTGRYNYFDPAWHPYYQGTDVHTMQSISQTVTAIIYGVAITRGDFKAPLNTPALNYFDAAKVKNVDDRKRHMTIEHLPTMTSGMNSEELSYPPSSDAPRTILFTWRPPTIGCNTRLMKRISNIAARPPSCWPTSFKRRQHRTLTPTGRSIFSRLRGHGAYIGFDDG